MLSEINAIFILFLRKMLACLVVLTLIIAIVSILCVINANRKDPEKIFGIYTQRGKWFYLKYYSFLFILNVRHFATKWRKADTGLESNVLGDISKLDEFIPLSNEEKAFDAVFFQAVDNSRGYFLCGGIERRPNDKVNGVFYIVVPGLGLLRSEHLPKTELTVSNRNAFDGGGIHFSMIEAMKKWKVAYHGKMWLDNADNKLDVNLNAEWTSNYPHFMFDTDMDKRLIAEAIARENWNRQLFDNLKSAHQTHYEQMGYLKGTLTVNGATHNLDMSAFRDHSFGMKRDWSLMHRYAFHMMYLEDNTRICIGVVSQPCTTSHLQMGYLVTPNRVIHPIRSCNLHLYQHGEQGHPGKYIAFSFMANDRRYDVLASTLYECEHFKGNDVEARLIERFNTYEVNGVKGKGISEWHYNNMHNKNKGII